MAGQVLAFQPRSLRQPGWDNTELAEFYRLQDLLHRVGLPVASDVGETDEGDPWLVFFRTDTGDVLVHFAREGSRFIAVSALNENVLSGRNLRDVVDQIMRGQPLVLPAGSSASGATLRMHPVTVLLGFIAAALLHSQQAHAATSDSEGPRGEPKGAWKITLPPPGAADSAPGLGSQGEGGFFPSAGALTSSIALLMVPADAVFELPWSAAPNAIIPTALPIEGEGVAWRPEFNGAQAGLREGRGDIGLLFAPPHAVEFSHPSTSFEPQTLPSAFDSVSNLPKPGQVSSHFELTMASQLDSAGAIFSVTPISLGQPGLVLDAAPSLPTIAVHVEDLTTEARLLLTGFGAQGAASFTPIALPAGDLTPEAAQLFLAAPQSAKPQASILAADIGAVLTTSAEHTLLSLNQASLASLASYIGDSSHALAASEVPNSVLQDASKAAGLTLDAIDWVVLYTGPSLPAQALALGPHILLLSESELSSTPNAASSGAISGQTLQTDSGTIDLVGVVNLQHPASTAATTGGLDSLLAFANDPQHELTSSAVPPNALLVAAEAAGLPLEGVRDVLLFNSKTFPLHAVQLGDGVALLDESLLPLSVVGGLGGPSAGQPVSTSAGTINLVGMIDLAANTPTAPSSGGLDQIVAYANSTGHFLSTAILPSAILDTAAATAGLPLNGIDRLIIYHSTDLPVHALDVGSAVAMLDEATLPAATIAALGGLGAGQHIEVSAGEVTLVGVVDLLHHGN